ncbi:unnamed protein product, partial [Sphacelaria rigidula]
MLIPPSILDQVERQQQARNALFSSLDREAEEGTSDSAALAPDLMTNNANHLLRLAQDRERLILKHRILSRKCTLPQRKRTLLRMRMRIVLLSCLRAHTRLMFFIP